MELKNRSFQYGKLAFSSSYTKTLVLLQFVPQSGRCLHGHMRVVKHATVELIGQWCSGRSNATPRCDAVSSGRRRESCYGRRVAGARPTPKGGSRGGPHAPQDAEVAFWSTAIILIQW